MDRLETVARSTRFAVRSGRSVSLLDRACGPQTRIQKVRVGTRGEKPSRHGEGDTEATEIGQITLAKFLNPSGLSAVGRNLYAQTTASGDYIEGVPGLDGLGLVRSGYLEMSNVEAVEEMVNLIVAQRAYEINSKAIQTSEDMMQVANNLKR